MPFRMRDGLPSIKAYEEKLYCDQEQKEEAQSSRAIQGGAILTHSGKSIVKWS